jgi:hypothetical protein
METLLEMQHHREVQGFKGEKLTEQDISGSKRAF